MIFMTYLHHSIKLQYIIMSWYMQSPSIQPRGIKVDGYSSKPAPIQTYKDRI